MREVERGLQAILAAPTDLVQQRHPDTMNQPETARSKKPPITPIKAPAPKGRPDWIYGKADGKPPPLDLYPNVSSTKGTLPCADRGLDRPLATPRSGRVTPRMRWHGDLDKTQSIGRQAVSQRASAAEVVFNERPIPCLLYTSPSPRDRTRSRMPSSA